MITRTKLQIYYEVKELLDNHAGIDYDNKTSQEWVLKEDVINEIKNHSFCGKYHDQDGSLFTCLDMVLKKIEGLK